MLISSNDGLIVLQAESDNKITNKERSFFTTLVYLGDMDNIDDYEEVCREVWKDFVEVSDSDYDVMKEKLTLAEENVLALQSNQDLLEDSILSTDYRLTLIEIDKYYGATIE